MDGKSKRDGFDGELCVVVPRTVIEHRELSVMAQSYYVTDIGYFPKARQHFRQRKGGSKEHILIHCVDGKGRVKIGKEEWTLKANQFVLIPSGMGHGYEADMADPWSIYWLHFRGSQADVLVDGLLDNTSRDNNVLIFGLEQKHTFEKMYKLLSKGYGSDVLDAIALILPYFLSTYLHRDMFDRLTDSSKSDVIDLAIEFLRTKIDSRLSLKEIAEHNNLSVSHFSKLFKSRTGYSPIEYLNYLKIQEACYILQFSDLRISEISFRLGFDDQYYFSRLFKEHMGVSPLKYRNTGVASG